MAGTIKTDAKLVFGLLLVAVYWVLESLLPRGAQEFAYFPFNPEPMPFNPMRGFTLEQLIRRIAALLFLAPGLLLTTAGLVPRATFREGKLPSPARLAQVIGLISVCLIAWVMFGILEGRAFVDDELTYRVQARLLSEGRIADPTAPISLLDAFTIVTQAGFTGKYLFGEPLVQVPGVLVGIPALMHIPLALLTLGCVWRAAKLEAGEHVALFTVALVGLSPMYVATSGTALSHNACLFAMAVAWLGLVEVRHERAWLGASLVAMGVGFGLTVRIQSAASFGAALAIWTAVILIRRRRFAPLALAALLAALWAGLIAVYNHNLSGSASTLPWYLYRAPEKYGFGRIWTWDTYEHTFGRALENLLVVGVQFNQWWLGWPLSLGLLVVWWRLGRPMQGVAPLLVAGLAQTALLFAYYSTGISDTGPIYYFEMLLPAGLMGSHALVGALERWPKWAPVALVVHVGLGTTGFYGEQLSRLRREIELIHAPVEKTLDGLETPAIVLTEIWPEERNNLGWIHSAFPRRAWSSSDPIVYLPRVTSQRGMAAVRSRYPDRECWYYRIEPDTREPELWLCDEAWHLLSRSWKSKARRPLAVESTAMQLNMYDPLGNARRRQEASLRERGITPQYVEDGPPREIR